VLRRSIDFGPAEPPFAEKFFFRSKRACFALAVLALAISTLDLMNISLVKAAGAYLHELQQRSVSLRLAESSATNTMAQKLPAATHQATPIQLVSIKANSPPASELTMASILSGAGSILRSPSPGERLHLTGALLAKAESCLASAIYFEARAEPARGQSAVAQVVLNRVFSGHFPDDICDVVYQSVHQRCQFSFACRAARNVIKERGAWARANRITARTLAGDSYDPTIGSSTHFHAVNVHPDWVHEMRKIVRYGTHNFYRPIAWGSGTNAPVWGSPTMVQNNVKSK
jgi:hypothetical protein